MRIASLLLALATCLPITSHSMEALSIETASILDTVTTAVALEHGARELNPLGFPAATAIKFFVLIPYVNNIENQEERKNTENFFSSVYTAAAVNNVMVMLGVGSIISLGAAILTYKQLRK